MATLKKLKNAKIVTMTGAPGKSIKVDTDSHGQNDAELYHTPGVMGKPVDETQGIEVDVNGLSIIIATHDYKIDKTLDKGETLLYSVNASGTILSSVLLNDAGEFVINGGARPAAAFDKLKEGFDDLNTKYNDLVTKYNAHIHITTATVGIGPAVGVISPTVSTETPSTATIDQAESDTVLIP